ncbi:BTB/POZ domain-containing protein-like [Dorcoceras hygrometricum]|uniref:BTB/POZ domain-containing protein-like n=1 Tax=Dorcoceras hygrometricum TaxID=472368 RepID=A0A2Z7AZW7_9LAMI|nr:BTB/POZ domain-containing protein-like [Dorcoceras hygrometricum]
MSAKKKLLLSTAMERTTEWIFSQEIPSDLTVNAGGTSFSLHKFPLVSKSGYIRRKLLESEDTDHSTVEIPDIPGGGEAFELVAKFCYGINFEITTENIAMLRCAAEYLEMTEEHSVGNLISRTESYINEMALTSISGAISILRSSENLLPIAEKVRLVSRSIDTISTVACKDSQFGADSGLNESIPSTGHSSKPVVDWWAEDLTVLRVDMFQRVLIAMMARGFKQDALAPILMLYAQKSLRGLAHPDLSDMDKKKVCSTMDCQKLSREACAHAAQNDRLPVQTVVQVLYYEQQRLREAMAGSQSTESPALLRTLNPSNNRPVVDEPALSLRRENQDLKQELMKMKMRLDEMEKSSRSTTPAVASPRLASRAAPGEKKSFIGSVSRKFGKFIASIPGSKGRNRPTRDRRHSIS